MSSDFFVTYLPDRSRPAAGWVGEGKATKIDWVDSRRWNILKLHFMRIESIGGMNDGAIAVDRPADLWIKEPNVIRS